jgi:RNA polymerase sigma factor (TIGR02999 family)
MSEITRLLVDYGRGDRAALDRVLPLLYDELHAVARARMRAERPGHTMGTTGLVHEAYMRLVDVRGGEWEGRKHFLSLAARVMRRILVDHARRRQAAKRGGAPVAVTLDEALWVDELDAERMLDLHDALERLAREHRRPAQAIELHFFGGLTTAETAEAVGASVATVERDLRFARAWLAQTLGEAEAEGS